MKYPRLSRFTIHVPRSVDARNGISRCFPVFPSSRFLAFLAVAILLVTQPVSAQVLEIPDPNLESAIRETLALPDEIVLTQPEMLRLTRLDAMDSRITDLTGLQHATSLRVLDLRDNLVEDLTPLANLTQLTRLPLDNNQIDDISPLANLTNLTHLGLTENQISNISPLANLTLLENIGLSRNQITDISPLAGLIRLADLTLDGNQIADISPLMNLTNLTHLGLNGNQITDISPLANLTQLRNIGLSANEITNISSLSGLIRLESLGLNRNPITDLSSLANLTNLNALYLSGGRLINDITPLANLTQLMHLRLSGQSISDITPLANLTQLIHLRLDGNQVHDISPLANLTLLEELRLHRNTITDITPLIGLKNLRELHLADNPIHDLTPLAELHGIELDIEIDLSQLDELNVVVEIPDPNLKQAIRDALSLPEDIPLTKLQMQRLTRLSAWDSGITDLTGLEHATYLEVASLVRNQIRDITPIAGLIHLELVALDRNPISDISPLTNLTNLKHLRLLGEQRINDITPVANLTQLEHLNLSGQAISDITPLTNLTQLIHLNLANNHILDFTPLARLVKLEELLITQNPGIDFSPLQALNLTKFSYDEVCEIPPLGPPIRERIENRTFPSIFQAWDDVVGLDHLTWEQRNVLHDLHWSPRFEVIHWDVTPAEPAEGLATSLAGNLSHALEVRQRRLAQNPNMVFLRGFGIQVHFSDDKFPPDSDFWLRDENGEILRQRGVHPLINFLKPEVQDLIVKRIIAFERCGLYDGVFFDGFNNNGTGFVGRSTFPFTDEEIIQALLNIFSTVRTQVREDFLIVVNANRSKLTRLSRYINGGFMETSKDYPDGYTHGGLNQIESTLLWSGENLRDPQITCLEGEGMSIEPPDGPNNLRWMRLFTTLSLTHSDGYVIYTTGFRDLGPPHPHHDHLWHDFWDADLGHPVGTKAQHHQNIEGLFIREFTNGWAVYNRSGTPQTITLPASATPVSDRGNNAANQTHLLPDLDGEIYLKLPSPYDLNRDGTINVLDLLLVSQHFGTATGDVNGDGTTNILDLTLVAQQFNQ